MQIDTEAILNELLESVIEDEGLNHPEVVIKPVSSGGANYTSTLYTITVRIPGGDDLELFAKVACLGEHVRNAMRAERFFANERFFYRDLQKIYGDLQVRSKIPEDQRLFLPKFYACSDERLKETLILENLVAKGYVLYDRLKSVTWEYAAAAMDELAKLHALSYAFAADDPEKFTKVAAKTEMMFAGCADELDKMWQKSEANALNALPEHLKSRLNAFLIKESGSKGFLNYSITNRGPVLLHGDYRPSNLLHKMTIRLAEIICSCVEFSLTKAGRASQPVRRLKRNLLCGRKLLEKWAAGEGNGLIVGERGDGGGSGPPEISLTKCKATAEADTSIPYSVKVWYLSPVEPAHFRCSQDDKLEKLIPVDYQTIYGGPTMCDIYYFIFSGTDGEFRRQHFRPLLDRYYTSFSHFLKKLQQNPEEMYPREHYEEDVKKFLPYGLLVAVLFLPLILVDEECAPSFDGDAQLSDIAVEPNKIYEKRILEVVEDFVEWGIL
ncbi:hypothetical protein EVAR_86678_1 [Eumeta japonica]|uniref:CHK kinase-like domain-containing protein n=1 Tax=Eumeta variegata TaxID=151549 RepID=A0A4C1XZ66_EUMVA|nr:hypothetical protein EVAR_86678_1 [Eumeta japonica]